jgi:hypothetical protein
MSGPGDVLNSPTRDELVEQIKALIEGTVTRKAVSDWAGQWVRLPNPNVDDAAIWKALQQLSGADLHSSRDRYLHSEEDFRAWLSELEGS